jgi:transcriptional regulator with XRE-family HTH domain
VLWIVNLCQYCVTVTQDAWAKDLTAVVAAQVKRWRDVRGMSAQQLADTTATLGLHVPRSVLANLESGRRDVVSVAELLVLARALRIPPVLLVFPIGRQPTVEALPGVQVPTWPAARWFGGDAPFPGDSDETLEITPVHAFREQDRLGGEVITARRELAKVRAQLAGEDGEPKELLLAEQLRKALEREVLHSEQDLRQLRAAMRQGGLDPGPLPKSLVDIEAEKD